MLDEFIAINRDEIIRRCREKVANGRIYARTLPGKGCIVTVDLPRCPASRRAC
jgi:hypothetical protein